MAAAMIFGMAHPVMAQDFVLPVTQTMDVSGGKAASAGDISVTYTLTAEDGAPMPDGAANGKYIFSIAGNERVQLAFSYDTAGDYSYVLERTDVTGAGGGTINGDPEKVRIVNSVNTEDRRITAAITILEGTYDIGKKMTECRFDYRCALRQITGTPAPSAGPSGHNGTGKVSGRSGGGSAGGKRKCEGFKCEDRRRVRCGALSCDAGCCDGGGDGVHEETPACCLRLSCRAGGDGVHEGVAA